jgi:cell division control protein 6
MQVPLQEIFEEFLNKATIFVDKHSLSLQYQPHEILHRDKQIRTVAQILAPILKKNLPSNMFVYGKNGTGKTLIVKYVSSQLQVMAQSKNVPLKYIYLNCKMRKVADTEYRVISQLSREFGHDVPPTGLPTDEVYKIFFDLLNEKERFLLLVLDEIDKLVEKCGDDILYNLTRINETTKSKIVVIGISNDITFKNSLSSRVRSSLLEEEVVFPPYDAVQLKDILKKRAEVAFTRNSVDESVISKCAAYAARDHGDARRALNLLRVSGEIAERQGSDIVSEKHVDTAEDQIERDKVQELIQTLPLQSQAVLYSIISLYSHNGAKPLHTGDIFNKYNKICMNTTMKPLTQRRISDLIAELDSLGMINAQVISKGRYGRTREITINHPKEIMQRMNDIIGDTLGM